MALFKTFKGLSEHLMSGKPNAVEGYAYFTTDDGKFYIDISTANTATIGTNRIPLSADYADRIPYGTCNSNYLVTSKIVSTTNSLTGKTDPFTYKAGSLILVKFLAPGPMPETDTSNNRLEINVNNTGMTPVYYNGSRIPNRFIVQNKLYLFRLNTYLDTTVEPNVTTYRYDLVGDVIPELGGNETVITDDYGNLDSRPLSGSFEIVQNLPTTNIDNNKVYLVPTGTYSGGSGSGSGSGSGGGSGLTYTLSKSGSTITLTASNGTTSSVTDVGLTQVEVQTLIDATITAALSTSYPSL